MHRSVKIVKVIVVWPTKNSSIHWINSTGWLYSYFISHLKNVILIVQNLPKGCFDCDLVFWLILSSDDSTTHFYPPSFSRDELFFSFCLLTPHFFVSNRLICIVEKVENEILINIVALCKSNFFFIFCSWKRICQLKELGVIKLLDNNSGSTSYVVFIFAKTFLLLPSHINEEAKLFRRRNLS